MHRQSRRGRYRHSWAGRNRMRADLRDDDDDENCIYIVWGCVRACANSSSAHSCGVLQSAGETSSFGGRTTSIPRRLSMPTSNRYILYTASAMSHTLLWCCYNIIIIIIVETRPANIRQTRNGSHMLSRRQ